MCYNLIDYLDNDNDIYVFDLIKETWEKKIVSQSAPSQRWGYD
jgi:hypothetical protein